MIIRSFRNKLIFVMISYTVFITVLSAVFFYEGLHISENGYLRSVISYHYDRINKENLPEFTPVKLDFNTYLYRLTDKELPQFVRESREGEYEFEMSEVHYRIARHHDGELIVIMHEDVAKLLDQQEEYLEQIITILSLLSIVIGSVIVSYLVILLTRRVVRLSREVDLAIEKGSALPRFSSNSPDEIDNLSNALSDYSETLLEFIEREKYFTRHASHELRTPISVIRNSYHILRQSELTDRQMKVVERIGKASDKAGNLTAAFLMLARHHSQTTTCVSLGEILQRLLDDHEKQLNAMGIDLTSAIGEVKLSSHKALVEILFSNIVTNVINHGEKYLNITLDNNQLVFINGSDGAVSDGGFGVDICEKICDFLGFDMHISTGSEYKVIILFRP